MDIKDFIDRLEPEQATTADASPSEDLILMSVTSAAVSLKRIADLMEKAQEPIDVRAEDIERDPLMLIARALEELSRPTLPTSLALDAELEEGKRAGKLVAIAEREAKAIEELVQLLKTGRLIVNRREVR